MKNQGICDTSNILDPSISGQRHLSHRKNLGSPAPGYLLDTDRELTHSWMKHTRFFVEDILRPEFGRGNVRSGSPHQPNSPVTPPPSRVEQLPQRDTSLGERLGEKSHLWPAWVFCTRYSDRPSSGPRTRKVRKRERAKDEKRPRTAFTADQLDRLKEEFTETHYLSEERRRVLASQLGLNEAQIKIWFQNKRAKLKKSSSTVNPLAQKLMEEGLYNHSTSNHGNS